MTIPIILWDQAYNRSGEKIQRAVVNAIRTHVDNTTLAGFVRRETLARYTGLTIKQVDRQIAANIAAGWLVITSSGHRGKANEYLLTYPKKKDVHVRDSDVETFSSTNEGHLRPTHMDKNVAPTTPITTPITTPRTSPKRSSDREDPFETENRTRSRTVMEDPWAEPPTNQVQPESDPFGSEGDDLPLDATTPVPMDKNVALSRDVSVQVDFIARHREFMSRENPFYEPLKDTVVLWPSGTPFPSSAPDEATTYLDDRNGDVLHRAKS